jgi:RimJ/RimL family protein N-acetyltransferase
MSFHLSVEPTASAPALRLRPWRAEDADALVHAHRDALMRRWLITVITDEAAARDWLDAQAAGWAAGTAFTFAITEEPAEPGRPAPPLGHIAVREGTGPAEGAAEVGYWTVPEARGRGVAPRALEVVSEWAFGPNCPMPLTWIALLHAKANESSCRVAEKSRYELRSILPPFPPQFPGEGHFHVRTA